MTNRTDASGINDVQQIPENLKVQFATKTLTPSQTLVGSHLCEAFNNSTYSQG